MPSSSQWEGEAQSSSPQEEGELLSSQQEGEGLPFSQVQALAQVQALVQAQVQVVQEEQVQRHCPFCCLQERFPRQQEAQEVQQSLLEGEGQDHCHLPF